jgi:phage terminase large subunit-like protein
VALWLPDPKWQPAFYTRPLDMRNASDGEDVADFAELLLNVSKGFKAGAPLDFTAWQRWLVQTLFERRSDGRLRYRKAVVGLPRKNGKSLLGTAVALHHLLYGPHGAEVYSAAGSRQQASIVFAEARQQVLNSPTLSRVIKVYRDSLWHAKRGSVYRALSAEAMQAHGLNPSLVIADEVHGWPSNPNNHRGDELWAALESGSGARPESLLLGISTAGGHKDTLLGRLYEYGQQVASGEVIDPSFGAIWWEAPAGADPSAVETWMSANPNLAEGLFDVEDFESAYQLGLKTGIHEFQRYRLNQWVRLAGEEYVPELTWRNAYRKAVIPQGETVFAGFDGSVSGDATGIVIMDEHGTMDVFRVWEPDPRDPDWSVDRDDVNEAIADLFDTYDCKLLYCDPSFFETDVEEWSRRYRKRVERIPPTTQRMVPMGQQFLADLAAGEIGHRGDNVMTRHVLNAVSDERGSFKKEKKGSPRKIDLLACAVLANGARTHYMTKRRGVVNL